MLFVTLIKIKILKVEYEYKIKYVYDCKYK